MNIRMRYDALHPITRQSMSFIRCIAPETCGCRDDGENIELCAYHSGVEEGATRSETADNGATWDRAQSHSYTIPDGPKMLRETLAVAQTWIGISRRGDRAVHIERLQRLIDECDRKRPVGSDGGHGDLHTPECGCDYIERRSKSMRKDADREVIDHEYTPRIEKLLIGRRVVAVDERTDTLLLDNGTEIEVLANEGCGGCSSGWYSVRSLAACDNVITKVEFDYGPSGDFDEDEEPGRYRIFVYAEHQKINLVDITGDDGNGYYGTGFQLVVRRPRP